MQHDSIDGECELEMKEINNVNIYILDIIVLQVLYWKSMYFRETALEN